MQLQVLTHELWPTISRLARGSMRSHVAVAYLGTDASKLLRLKSGDSLVVDMSEAAVKNGQTNPSEVERYLDKNVDVYNCPNLHAKTFVFDNYVVVGSANVSKHSQNNLIEAGLVCEDRGVAAQVKGWMKDLHFEPVTPEYIRFCKRIYTRPRFPVLQNKRGSRSSAETSRMWLLAIQDTDYSDREEEISDKDVETLMKKFREPGKYKISTVRLPASSTVAKSARVGDLIVQIWTGEKKTKVYPPCRLARKRLLRKTSRVFVYLEEPKRSRTRTWKQFKAALRKIKGTNRITENSERPIALNDVRHAILGLWN